VAVYDGYYNGEPKEGASAWENFLALAPDGHACSVKDIQLDCAAHMTRCCHLPINNYGCLYRPISPKY
jgi:hypothetical protein